MLGQWWHLCFEKLNQKFILEETPSWQGKGHTWGTPCSVYKIEHSKVPTIGAPCWLDKESKCTVQIFPMELCCFSCNYANTFFVVFKSYYLLHPKRNLCWTDLLILKVPSNFPSFLKMVKQLYLIATALAASISCLEDEFSCRAHETQASMKIIWVSQHTSLLQVSSKVLNLHINAQGFSTVRLSPQNGCSF